MTESSVTNYGIFAEDSVINFEVKECIDKENWQLMQSLFMPKMPE